MTNLTNSTLAKLHAIRFAERNHAALARMGDMIFYYGELGMQEFRTAELLTGTLQRGGFDIVRNLSGFPTGFMATFGSGHPVIALHCEFDGNPGNSQVPGIAEKKEIVPGAPGHCEGHNLNAAVTATAALAIKSAMDAFGLPGTLKVFGAPAEEQLISRPYYVRDGHFDDVDIAFHAHVLDEFKTEYGLAQLGMMSVQFTFLGMSAHSAMSPWEGRDALDAAVLMDVGMAQFREHMKPGMSAHRVFTEGGTQPNVIPARTTCWWFFRDRSPEGVRALFQQGERIARGAAMMANCEVETSIMAGVWPVRGNETIARIIQDNIDEAGMPAWSAERARLRAPAAEGRAEAADRTARVGHTLDRTLRTDHGVERLRRRILGCADGPRLVSGQYSARRVPSLVGRRSAHHLDRPQGRRRRSQGPRRVGARLSDVGRCGRRSLENVSVRDRRSRLQIAAACDADAAH